MNSIQNQKLSGQLKWVEKLSYLLDNKFRFPGTNFRFGLDPILNLIPIAGDIGGFVVSAVLVATMAKHGASRKVAILMAVNIILDATIGAIPILGQVFDFFYKANAKNINLLKEHYVEGKHQGNGNGIVVVIIIIFCIVFILLLYIIWKLIAWFVGLF